MDKIQYHIVSPAENDRIRQITDWYFSEWKIPILETVQRLTSITADPLQCQVLLIVNGLPVATGGLYSHLGLIDKVPGFNVYRNWLALVYPTPGQRKKGYGAMVCKHVETHAQAMGIEKIYLFTDTAEHLYRRLGWTELQRLPIGVRNIVVMEKKLFLK